MKDREHQHLEQLYREAIQKRKEIRLQIISNEDRMQEIDRNAMKIREALKENDGFPKKEDIAKEELLKKEAEERILLSERNENLFSLMNDLDQQISQFKELLGDLS